MYVNYLLDGLTFLLPPAVALVAAGFIFRSIQRYRRERREQLREEQRYYTGHSAHA
jgi:hypothetical protein